MKDLTTGNEGKQIIRFAIPMLIGNVFQQAYHIIDSVIVGHYLGKEALAAVGASFPIIFCVISLTIGISMGSTVIISQYFGAKDMEKVRRAIDTMNIFLFFSAISLSILCIIFSRPIFRLLHLPDELLPMAISFFNIFIAGSVFTFGFNGISAILRGMGDSKTPLIFLVLSTVLNIILDFLFIIVFNWGLISVAFATIISQAFALFSSIIYLNRKHPIINISLKETVFDKGIFIKSFKIGLPTGIQQTFVGLGMMALMGIVNSFGTNVIAAYTIATRIDSFASMPAMNLAMALTSFVGQNIGARKSERVSNGFMATLKFSSIIAITISLIVFFFGDYLIRAFTTDINVIKIGHDYLKIVGSFYIAYNAMFVVGGIMRGAGDTFIPMIFTLFSLWIIRIPLAFALSPRMGPNGIWWSIPIAWILGTTLNYIYYRTGRWMKKSVIQPRTLNQ